MSTDILPDSRSLNMTGGVMADWELLDGTTIRVEMVPIYCPSCGKEFGWVPKDAMTFIFWLCGGCFEKYGEIAGTYSAPDEEFRQNVVAEMEANYGRTLTELELAVLADQDRLPETLKLLERESPYRPGKRA